MATKDWKTASLKVVNAWLDADNMRLDLYGQGATQEELIHDLFVNQDAFDILESIARKGYFPHELLIVTKENKKTVILEGNRRIAALKAAINPSLVLASKARIQELVGSSTNLPVEQIEVKVAPSRAEALPVIAEIHTTASRKRWATLRKAYFYFAQVESSDKTLEQLIDEYPGVNIPRFVRMWEMHRAACSIKYDRDEVARKVANQQKFPITTLERLYSNEAFRQALMIRFDENGQLQVDATSKSFKSALRMVVTDIVNGVVDSRKLNKGTYVAKHLSRWPEVEPKKGSSPLTAESFKPITPPKSRRKAKRLAPKDMVCALPYPAVARLLEELQTINYQDFPNATHDLLRTMLECSLKAYLMEKGLWKPNPKKWTTLNEILAISITHFESTKPNLVQPLKMIQGRGDYWRSQDYLNALNHNPDVFSTGELVKDAWDQMFAVLRYVLDPQ